MNRIKKSALAIALFAGGCTSIPNPGEFESKDLVSVPAHPGIMLMNGGKVEAEKEYNSDGQEIGYTVERDHWLAGERGSQTFIYPDEATNFGSNIGGGIFGIKTNRTYDIGNQRYLEKIRMGKGGKKVKSQKVYLLEKDGDKWEKGKRIE